ncbi:MAG TPA: hypothetical protein VIN06_13695 [Devosia sp.]
MFAVVNGYSCTSSCDVAVARRNIDPRNPHNDPVKAEQLAEADILKGKTPRDAPPDASRVNTVENLSGAELAPKRLVDLYA